MSDTDDTTTNPTDPTVAGLDAASITDTEMDTPAHAESLDATADAAPDAAQDGTVNGANGANGANSGVHAAPTAAGEADSRGITGGELENDQSADADGAADTDTDGDADADADADADGDGEDESAVSGAPVAKSGRVRALEREGEVAADFLETLLDIADLDGDLDVDVDGDRAAVAIVDSEDGRVPRRLIGTDGKVLEALQELTRLAVQAETGERSRLMLDIGGHRAARRTTLVDLAAAAIAEVRSSGTPKALEPMSAFERKVVHDEVTEAGLRSESEGVEPRRHIVIHPA